MVENIEQCCCKTHKIILVD